MARRPNAVAVAANRTAVAGMKPPPRPMMAISAARPPRMRTIALRIEAFARREVAAPAPAQKLPAASRTSAGGDDIRHRLRPDAVGRCELHRAGVPKDHRRELQLGQTYGLGPKAMPYVIAAGLALLAVGESCAGAATFPRARASIRKAIVLILGGLAALIAIIGLGGGFIPATTILFVATAAAFGRRAIHIDLAIGLVLALVVYLLFDKLLTLSLPAGPLERLL